MSLNLSSEVKEARNKQDYELRQLYKEQRQKLQTIQNRFGEERQKAEEAGQVTLAKQHGKNQQRILDSLNENERILTEIKDSAVKTRDALAQELETQKKVANTTLMGQENSFRERLDVNFAKNHDQMQTQQKDFGEKINEIRTKSEREVASLKRDFEHKGNALDQKQKHDLRDRQEKYLKELSGNDIKYFEALNKQKYDQSKVLTGLDKANRKQVATVTEMNQDALNQMRQAHLQKVEQQRESFDRQFQKIITDHKQHLEMLKERTSTELNDVKLSHSTETDLTRNKMQDQFYHMRELEPQVYKLDNQYMVEIAVPEHEKDTISLNVQDRLLRLTYSRRFEDKVKDEFGNYSSSSRFETVKKEMQVPDLLNPHKVIRSYQDGKVIYSIKLA